MLAVQHKSQVFPRGDGGGTESGVIARIFFPYDDARLDPEGYAVLERVSDILKMQLFGGRPIHARIIGHADRRGTSSYNQRLACLRAEAVMKLLDFSLRGTRAYTSVRVSRGESQACGKHAHDRRVDVVTNFQRGHRFDDDVIFGTYRGPLSRAFRIRVLGGTSASVSVGPFGLGGASMAVEIWNVRNQQKARFSFYGVSIGPGLEIGFNRPTRFEEMRSHVPVALRHFAGSGGINTMSIGVSSGSVLVFNGPNEHGLTHLPVTAKLDGWDFSIGAAVIRGRWERLHL